MPIFAPTSENIAHIAAALAAGEIAALPTETVYGLAADATNPWAVLKIYEAKGRPRFNPLIVHVPNLTEAQRYGAFSELALRLANAFWPGPLTLIVERAGEGLDTKFDVARAGLGSMTLRVPAHPLMQQVMQACGKPLAAPSANISGRISSTLAAHVAADFGEDMLILDGGACTQGLESTIIDCTTPTPTLLRAGALPRAAIEARVGPLADATGTNPTAPKAPGMLLQHYAPSAPVRLNATKVRAGEALLAFGPTPLYAPLMRNLSLRADLAEAALNVFAMLRELDSQNPAAIAVMPIPHEGLGEAINDRLTRAAVR
jgi:L-threonylcarbamoyladenylate synthase